ncbi:hypothetical protein SDC9_165722 [bioreactor metagenome]|uniref:Uncharacterized protein n=1 Tax=bioreactor metagenome TaxID=1076179 RepID=A0A645FXD0_9ZZZZ
MGDHRARFHEVALVYQDVGHPAGRLGRHVHLGGLDAAIALHKALIDGRRAGKGPYHDTGHDHACDKRAAAEPGLGSGVHCISSESGWGPPPSAL